MKEVARLLFELGVLCRTRRTGFYHIGITDHNTIAAHSFRTAILAYILSEIEGANTNKVLKMALIHDLPESRLLDHTFVQKKYFSIKKSIFTVLRDQLNGIKGNKELIELYKEFEDGQSKEAKVVRDADILETIIEAKEYVQRGSDIAKRFLDRKAELKTKKALKLFTLLQKKTIYWWLF
jgi:putative hydrolase of HD superfamily